MKEIVRIDRVVAEYDVWLGELFPFAKMRSKVLERQGGSFLAVNNLHILNKSSRTPEYISGLGSNLEEALEDLLTRFVEIVEENKPVGELRESDFVWSAPEDF